MTGNQRTCQLGSAAKWPYDLLTFLKLFPKLQNSIKSVNSHFQRLKQATHVPKPHGDTELQIFMICVNFTSCSLCKTKALSVS